MKLHFRGVDYDRQKLQLKSEDHPVRGIYRGSALDIHQHQVKNRHQAVGSDMTYRGIHYQHN